MTRPSEPVPIPAVVSDIAGGRPVDAVWVNELGGVTFEVDGGREYVKVTPPRWAHHFEAEIERLGEHGRQVCAWDDLPMVGHWRRFLTERDAYLRHLFASG